MKYIYDDNLCSKCHKVLPDNTYALCEECRAKHKARRMRRQEKILAQGLCVQCRKPNSNGHLLCDECLEKQRKINKNRYDWNVKNGICTQCGKNKALPGFKVCETCRKKSNEYAYERYWRNKIK